MSKYYVNDIGTEIVVDTGVDISTATTTTMKVKKPDGTLVEWDATIVGLTKLRYVVIAGDWNIKGKYSLQAYVEMPTFEGRGDTVVFEIFDSFK